MPESKQPERARSVMTHVRLPQELTVRLDARAEELRPTRPGITRSDLIREAVAAFLKETP